MERKNVVGKIVNVLCLHQSFVRYPKSGELDGWMLSNCTEVGISCMFGCLDV